MGSMEPTVTAPADFDPRRGLRGLALLGLVGLGQISLVFVLGRGVACPLREATGLLCPICGTTTAVRHLLQGDVGAAWGANPFTMLIALALALCAVCWLVEVAGGPATRPPRRLRPLTFERVSLAMAGPAVLFAILRNLL